MNCKLIGLLLPCNVVDYVDPEKGETVLGVIDPEMMVQATARTNLDVFTKVYEKNYKLHLIQFELK